MQEKIHLGHGSQCGFCTPGMVMSMCSELCNKSKDKTIDGILDVEDMEKCLQGNLCRCTGYRPIQESFDAFCRGKNNTELSTNLIEQVYPSIPNEILSEKLNHEYLHFVDSEVITVIYTNSENYRDFLQVLALILNFPFNCSYSKGQSLVPSNNIGTAATAAIFS